MSVCLLHHIGKNHCSQIISIIIFKDLGYHQSHKVTRSGLAANFLLRVEAQICRQEYKQFHFSCDPMSL